MDASSSKETEKEMLLPKKSPKKKSKKVRQRQQMLKEDSHTESSLSSNTSEHNLPLQVFQVEEDQPLNDTVCATLKQVSIPFIIAGAALVLSGLYFDHIQKWTPFQMVPEIIVLIPALLGLKGNLEMTLASRLSTEANLGLMNNSKEYFSIFLGNIALLQLQAILISFLTCTCGTALIYLEKGTMNSNHILMLYASCMATASLASLFLAVVTGAIVIMALKYDINPDNIATPIAAGLGDFIALLLLSWLASELYKTIDNGSYISWFIIIIYLLSVPIFGVMAKSNRHTSHIVTSGWIPVIISMLICMIAGVSLKHYMAKYKTFPAFQPVLIGVGGNIVSIQASRLSTSLHRDSNLGVLPDNTNVMISLFEILYAKDAYAVTSRVFLGLAVPGHFLFAIVIMLFRTSFPLYVGSIFITMYLIAAMAQVYILLVSAYVLTCFVWIWGVNPDTTTIPYLTAFGDILGILFLGIGYNVLNYLNPSDLL